MSTQASKELKTFPNPRPGRAYEITISTDEFTCLCPMTGQPDFATIVLKYIPESLCVELKSFKLYLWAYREEGAFHEDVTNRILDDIVTALTPRFAMVEGRFRIRGGLTTSVVATHDASSPPRITEMDRAADGRT